MGYFFAGVQQGFRKSRHLQVEKFEKFWYHEILSFCILLFSGTPYLSRFMVYILKCKFKIAELIEEADMEKRGVVRYDSTFRQWCPSTEKYWEGVAREYRDSQNKKAENSPLRGSGSRFTIRVERLFRRVFSQKTNDTKSRKNGSSTFSYFETQTFLRCSFWEVLLLFTHSTADLLILPIWKKWDFSPNFFQKYLKF